MELKGTTTIGLVCDGGIVLASEKRATMGTFIASKAAKKIYQIDDTVGMTTAGLVGDAQALARILSVEAKLYKLRRGEPMTVKGMVTLLSNVLNSQRIFPYLVQLLIGGVDMRGPSIYSLDAFGGGIEEKEIVATGSGSPIAYGILEDRYSPGLSMEEGTELAIRALHNTMKRDSASGDGMEVVRIDKEEYRVLKEDEIEKIRKSL
ncbi:MAG: archaeal proteasome endopeptidase complex subunit beta [Candidatus Syntropharchaeia archaeon]